MLGSFGPARIMRQYQDGKSAPSRDVTRDEFIAAAITAGWTSEDADRHARISSIMGSHVLVGKEKLRIAEG